MPDRDSPAPNHNGKPNPDAKTFPTANAAVAELERRHGKRAALWPYYDAAGKPVGLVVRWDRPEGKDIRPVSRLGDGWRVGAMPDPRPLYGLPDLAAAGRVVVTEGEKAADAARALGFTATTSAGGSQAPGKTDWRPLAGKEIWILPDNDAPGRKYAGTVASILAKVTPAPKVKFVELPNRPEHGDIVDWIDARGDWMIPEAMRAEVVALGEAVEPESSGPPADDKDHFRPFPVDALPQPIRGFVAAGANAIGCDASYLALPLLTALASAIGNTQRLQIKRGWYAPPIIWGAIVGESGTAKSPAFRLALRPVNDRQSKVFRSFAAEQAKHKEEMKEWLATPKGERGPSPEPPVCVRYIVSDTTVKALAPILAGNPRGLMLGRDELSGWIGSFDRYTGKGKASADAASWLSMHSAESITVDRKSGDPRTIHVPHAAVCISGGIQPDILARALTPEHRECGLAARLLLAYPPRRVKRWTEADVDPPRRRTWPLYSSGWSPSIPRPPPPA